MQGAAVGVGDSSGAKRAVKHQTTDARVAAVVQGLQRGDSGTIGGSGRGKRAASHGKRDAAAAHRDAAPSKLHSSGAEGKQAEQRQRDCDKQLNNTVATCDSKMQTGPETAKQRAKRALDAVQRSAADAQTASATHKAARTARNACARAQQAANNIASAEAQTCDATPGEGLKVLRQRHMVNPLAPPPATFPHVPAAQARAQRTQQSQEKQRTGQGADAASGSAVQRDGAAAAHRAPLADASNASAKRSAAGGSEGVADVSRNRSVATAPKLGAYDYDGPAAWGERADGTSLTEPRKVSAKANSAAARPTARQPLPAAAAAPARPLSQFEQAFGLGPSGSGIRAGDDRSGERGAQLAALAEETEWAHFKGEVERLAELVRMPCHIADSYVQSVIKV